MTKKEDIRSAEQKEHDIWNYPLEETPVEVFTDYTSDALWEYWYSCQKYMG